MLKIRLTVKSITCIVKVIEPEGASAVNYTTMHVVDGTTMEDRPTGRSDTCGAVHPAWVERSQNRHK